MKKGSEVMLCLKEDQIVVNLGSEGLYNGTIEFSTTVRSVLTPEEKRKVATLIKKECCNYDNGNCALLDDGFYHKCPQSGSNNLACAWFIDAVLPLNSVLLTELSGEEGATDIQCKG